MYYHHSKDVRVVPLLQKLQTFFEQQPIIHAGYELDGKPLADYSHIAFMAPVWCLFTVSLKVVACRLQQQCLHGAGVMPAHGKP